MTFQSLIIPGLGGPELIIMALIIMLLFGAQRLPELARSLGRSKKEFEKGKTDESSSNSGSKSRSRADLEKAAKELGINPEGKSDEELKDAIKNALYSVIPRANDKLIVITPTKFFLNSVPFIILDLRLQVEYIR